MSIPKIIHQTWQSNDFPFGVGQCVSSVRELNPSWDYRFYTDDDWRAVIDRQSLMDWESFCSFPAGIQKADLFRCIALYESGGVYADVDLMALRPLDDLVGACVERGWISEDFELLLTVDHPIHCDSFYGGRKILMNHFMIAKPGASFLGHFIRHVALRLAEEGPPDDHPLGTTGPIAITDLVEKMGGPKQAKIAILPHCWIHPLPDMSCGFEEWGKFDEMIRDGSWIQRFQPYFAHFWWHSNWPRDNMMNIYGEELFR